MRFKLSENEVYEITFPEKIKLINENGEVVAEGEGLTAQALADIIKRLEKIEKQIGEMIEK